MTTNEETITIPKRIYYELLEDSTWLAALEAAGVDNWEDLGFAHEIYAEWNEED